MLEKHLLKNPARYSYAPLLHFIKKIFYRGILFLHIESLRFGEKLTLSEQMSLQEKRTLEILQYAYDRVPFWHKRISESPFGTAANFKTLADIQKIPIVDKQVLKKENSYGLIGSKIPSSRIIFDMTSGSTGVPFRFCLDAYCAERETAMILRGPRWVGRYGLKDEFIRIFQGDFPLFSNFGTNMRLRQFPELDSIIDILSVKQDRSFLIYSHLSTMIMLARRMRKLGKILRPKVILVASERLFPEMKKFLIDAFKCPLSDSYGCREIDNIAQTCEEGSMHINTDHCLVEIVDERGQWVGSGKKGKIVVTSFNNYVMPLIRYDTGDVGSIPQKSCSCGLLFPLLQFDGRSMEFIPLPGGRIEHPFNLIRPFLKQIDDIVQYQIVRRSPDNFFVKIVSSSKNAEDLSKIKGEVEEILGPGINVELNIVDQIFKPGEKNIPYLDLSARTNEIANRSGG